MKRFVALLLVFLLSPVIANAGQFEDGEAAFSRQDFQTALRLWQPLADQGNADAQERIGWLYRDGRGVTRDYLQAMAWFRKAAGQGNAEALKNIGEMYEMGDGVTRDYAEAMKWLKQSSDKGSPYAPCDIALMYQMGTGVTKDGAAALKWYQLAADRGNVVAVSEVMDIQRSLAKAAVAPPKEPKPSLNGEQQQTANFQSLVQRAGGGDRGAQFSIGHAYWYGEGVARDPVQAYVWLSLSGRSTWDRGELTLKQVSAAMTPAQRAQADQLARHSAREWSPAYVYSIKMSEEDRKALMAKLFGDVKAMEAQARTDVAAKCPPEPDDGASMPPTERMAAHMKHVYCIDDIWTEERKKSDDYGRAALQQAGFTGLEVTILGSEAKQKHWDSK